MQGKHQVARNCTTTTFPASWLPSIHPPPRTGRRCSSARYGEASTFGGGFPDWPAHPAIHSPSATIAPAVWRLGDFILRPAASLPGDRPLARLAEAVQLHLVRGDLEPVLARHLVLQRLDAVVLELDDGAAPGADQVVVVVPADRRLVARLPVAEVARVGEPALVEQLHRPVHRGHRDPGILLAHLRPELLHRLVAAEREEGVDDQAPLSRALQAVLGHVATEKLRSAGGLTHG